MQKLIGRLMLVVLIFSTARFGQQLAAQEAHPSDLTANELAEALSIHWWTIKLPNDLKPKDMVGVEFVTSDGKRLVDGDGIVSETAGDIGDKIRVFCWEDETSHQLKVQLQPAKYGGGTFPYKDYFKDASVWSPGNGAVSNVGDILLKFDSSKNASFGDGNFLNAGQIGLKIVITRAH